MIEKLKTINPYDETEIDMDTNSVAGLVYENTPLIQKINELVDAVNGILDYAPLEMAIKAEPEPVDPYAESRKWIGCVCRFWYDNPNDTLLDYLDKIQTGKNGVIQYYSKESGDWFPHCEPVKPDSELIYHGEQQ